MSKYPSYTIATTPDDNINGIPNNSIATVQYSHYSTNNFFFTYLLGHLRSLPENKVELENLSATKFPLHMEDDGGFTFAGRLKLLLNTYIASDDDIYHPFIETLDNSQYIDVTKVPFHNSFNLNIKNIYDYKEVIEQTLSYSNQTSVTSESDPYPNSVRYITSNNKIYIERPPFKVIVNFKPVKASGRTGNIPQYEIWIPWTITEMSLTNYGVPTSSAKIFFSHSPFQSEDTKQYVACMMPNSYSDGSICFSNSIYDLPSEPITSIRYIYSLIINEYFSGGWNLDLGLPIVNLSYDLLTHRSRSNLNEIGLEYFNPTYNSLLNRFPSETDKTIKTYLNYSGSFSPSLHSKYFFKILSSMTLEETLNFYSNFTDKSFNQITGISKSLNVNYSYNHTNDSYSEILSDVNIRTNHKAVFPVRENFKKTISTLSFNTYSALDDHLSSLDLHNYCSILYDYKLLVQPNSRAYINRLNDPNCPENLLSNKYSEFIDNSLHHLLNSNETTLVLHDFASSDFEVVELNENDYIKIIFEIIMESCMKEQEV